MIYASLVCHHILCPLIYGNHPHPKRLAQASKAIQLLQVFSHFFSISKNQEENPFFKVIFSVQTWAFLEVTVISSPSFLGALSSFFRILHSPCLSCLQTQGCRTCYFTSCLQRLFVRVFQVTSSFDLQQY